MTENTQAPWGIIKEDSRSIYYINLISGVLIITLGVWGATQYCAYELGYQENLGDPWFILFGYPVYIPWRVFEWTYYYEVYARGVFATSYLFIYGSFAIEAILLVYIAVWRARRNKAGDAYGTARWSTEKELKEAGLFAGEGIVIGQTVDGQLLQHNGPEHALVFAPPRSGKGVGLVIPTLLAWKGSVIVYDIKRENWEITSGFRKKFSHVLRFEPTFVSSVKFNPLLEIRKGDNEYRDAQNIAEMIIDTGDPNHKNDHWERTSKALFIAAILHVLYAEKDKSIPGVASFLTDPNRNILQTLTYMMTYKHLGDRPHPIIASMIREVLNKSENELSAVLSTATSFLTLYRDPVIANNIRESDFAISDLMNLKNPVSLYFTIPVSDAERTKPLIRLVLNQIGRRITESMSHDHSQPDYRHKMLLMIDEFPTLGRMDFLESGLAYFPGYGIRAYLIAQSLNQIEKHYGSNNAILDTSHIRITYGALDEKTAKRISDLLGQSTQVRKMANYAGSRLAPWLGHVMVSEQESPRQLLTPGEILNMPPHANLILIGGLFPYYGRKVTYYNDPRFKNRANLPAPNSEEEQRKEFPKPITHPWVYIEKMEEMSVSHENIDPDGSLDISPVHEDGINTGIDNENERGLDEHELALQMESLEDDRIKDEKEYERDEDRNINNQQAQRRLINQRQQGRLQELSRDQSGGDLPL